MSTMEQIESTISRLPRKLQKQVVERLNARLWPTGFDPAVEDAWSHTVKRRVSEMDSGKVEGIPASRVFARSRRLLARR
ncbi:MAG: addiction module protein [Verrucomicrobia bacterium]|nr:addiction module protein [Verrucomicrobiota bacterium]